MSTIKTALDTTFAQLTSEASPWAVSTTSFDGIEYKYYPKAPQNLIELLDEGRKHGDNEFVAYDEDRLSFNQFFEQVDALAWQLQNTLQIKPGDRVAIAMRNYPEWMVAFAAIANVGAVIVPLNSWGRKAEITYGLTDSQASAAIFDQQRFDYIADDLATLSIQAIVARSEKELPSAVHRFEQLTREAKGKKANSVTIDSESLAMIMYTAGTTGEPKGAMASHRNICQAIYNFELAAIAAAMCNGEAITKMLERGFPSKTLLAIPLFHISGCYSVFLLSLRGGRGIYIMHKWDKQKALETIEKERITTVYAVPSMLMDLLDAEQWDDYDTKSLFAFGAGGSAQPPHLAEQILKQIPNSLPGTGYGMTETSATGFASTGAAYTYKPKSCGVATPIIDVRIVDDQGQTVKPGETGEIWLKSPGVVQGYWNKPEVTASTFVDGWALTGDIGYLDDEGFLYITDRIKDVVIRGGENITSIEVETTALNHPAIQEAAVFGLPDDKLGEELAIAVVLKPGKQVSAEELQAHIGKQLAQFKIPSKVFFEQELPRNATFKVLKQDLKNKYS